MSSHLERQRKAVIVGAGPVGCLAAFALARHGWNVAVYESRPGLLDVQIQTSVTQSNLSQTYAFLPLKLLPRSVPSI